jgi:TfoX/Sxy family transcriptional regulator of competence genes
MQIPKPTARDRARFEGLVPDDPRVEVKPMFGNLGAFVQGNMFMGLFGSAIGVKLADADAATLREAGGGPFGPVERPMSGYVALPPDCTPAKARTWAEKSLAHVAALAPKKPKRATTKKNTKA